MDAWDKNHVGLLPIAEIFDGSYGKSYGGASVNGGPGDPPKSTQAAGEVVVAGAASQEIPLVNAVTSYITGYTVGMNIEAFSNGVAQLLVILGVSEAAVYGPAYDSFGKAYGKGERNKTGKADGTGNPWKHTKQDPNKPGNILEKDGHTGKWRSKPKPPGWPGK